MQLHSFEKCTNQEQGVSNLHDRVGEGSAFIKAETNSHYLCKPSHLNCVIGQICVCVLSVGPILLPVFLVIKWGCRDVYVLDVT